MKEFRAFRVKDRLPLGLLTALTGAYLGVYVFRPGRLDGLGWLTDSSWVLAAALGAWTIWRAAQRHTGRLRRGWRAVAAGLGSYALGNALWTYTERVLHLSPFPSVSDAFYLATPLFFLVGVAAFSPPLGPGARVRLGLDVAVVVTSAGTFSWVYLLAPTLLSYDGHVWPLFFALVYPVLDLVLLSLLVMLMLRPDAPPMRGLELFCSGLACWIVFDVLFAVSSLAGTYSSGHPVNLVWLAAVLLVTFAASQSVARPRGRPERKTASPFAVTPYLPYLAITLSYGLLLSERGPSAATFADLGVLCCTALVTVLVVTRQVLSVRENRRLSAQVALHSASVERSNAELRRLSGELERRVQERTAALAALSRRYQHDALHDALTGLPNRAGFQKGLQEAVAGADPFALLYLDFDRFKAVNDSFGHAVGDALLAAIGRRLVEVLGAAGLVARLGGDEFAVLLTRPGGAAEAAGVAETLLGGFGTPIGAGGHLFHCTASIGVVVCCGHCGSAENVLRDADIAMYRAKAAGRSRYAVFEASMRGDLQARLELEIELRAALARGELAVHYQPVVRCGGGTLVGFEALVRWPHPERGLVSPGEFVPLAEETGLIVELDRWVLRTACAQLGAWSARWPGLTLSVNLSSRGFARPDLADVVAATLAETGLAPQQLKLELTESLLTDRSVAVKDTLVKLRELGVRLYIDDFGTGYSSLSYLQRFDADALKIDRSFVSRMLESGDSAELVRTILNMAHNLGMQVVAEGVETPAQHARLRALGCEYAQGFLFSRPLPAAAAAALLEGSVGKAARPPGAVSTPERVPAT